MPPARPPERVLLGASVLVFAVMVWLRRWVCDDAFIDFRVVQNCLAGHGPVFNLGERVEAYSNPAWVALLVVVHRLGLPLEPSAAACGGMFAVAGFVATLAAAWRLAPRITAGWWSGLVGEDAAPDAAAIRLPLGAAVLAALPPMWDFATSGLEMGLAFAWLGGSFWAVVRAATRAPERRAGGLEWSAAAVWIGIGLLVRPDLAVFALVFLIALCISSARGWRAAIVACAGAAILPLGYEIFRMGYFAALVSNSTLAKEPGLARWGHGWQYARELLRTQALVVPFLALVPIWIGSLRGAARRSDRRSLVVLVAPAAGALLHGLAVIRAGGDFMYGRLLLPSVWGAALAVAVVPLPVRPRRRVEIAAWAMAGVVLVWAVVSGVALHPRYLRGHGPYEIADERGFYVWESRHANPIRSGDFSPTFFVRDGLGLAQVADSLAARSGDPQRILVLTGAPAPDHGPMPPRLETLGLAAPRSTLLVVARRNIGLTGFVAGPRVRILDRHGLADPIAARLRVVQRGRPGHEKWLPDVWIVARFAATDSLDASERAARHALACAPLAELLDAVTAPLDAARFARNLRRAPRLSRLRFAADPAIAERELCGEH